MATPKPVLATPCLAPAHTAAPVLVGVALVAALAGCTPSDPVWDMPCAQRPAQEVLVGTGGAEFVAADADLIPVQNGSQGGQHIWVSLRLHGFGPEGSVAFGILDATDPKKVYSGPNQQRFQLRYNQEEDASEVTGLYGYLANQYDPDTQMQLPGPEGQQVILWADVSDACSAAPVHAESTGQVQ